jgi:iron-sulfur cluster repair protein YtfE (RIC family)
MPTIGNLPAADVQVTFPSGETRTVNMIVLHCEMMNARTQALFGHALARNAPTLKAIREKYEIPVSACRTWRQGADQLKRFHDTLTDHINAHREGAIQDA